MCTKDYGIDKTVSHWKKQLQFLFGFEYIASNDDPFFFFFLELDDDNMCSWTVRTRTVYHRMAGEEECNYTAIHGHLVLRRYSGASGTDSRTRTDWRETENERKQMSDGMICDGNQRTWRATHWLWIWCLVDRIQSFVNFSVLIVNASHGKWTIFVNWAAARNNLLTISDERYLDIWAATSTFCRSFESQRVMMDSNRTLKINLQMCRHSFVRKRIFVVT